MANGQESMSTSVARFEELQPIDYASFIKNYKPDGTQGYATGLPFPDLSLIHI